MTVVPVLLDTDIGSDIDDAICLAYLLAQPRCDLRGVTTVSGMPRQRAALAVQRRRSPGERNGARLQVSCWSCGSLLGRLEFMIF